MKFMTSDSIKDILRRFIISIDDKLDLKVTSVTSANPDEIYVDNSNPKHPVIGLSDGTLEKLDKLWEEVFGEKVITDGIISTDIQPITGHSPIIVIEGSQWKGTIIWNPSITNTFEGETVYSASISIEAKSGYTLEGIDPSIFVIGLDNTTLSYQDGIITIVFKSTDDIVKEPEDTPISEIDFIKESLTVLEPYADYLINSTLMTANADGEIPIESTWFGVYISIVKKATDDTMSDSQPQVLSIPTRPIMPVLTKQDATLGNSDGEIFDVDTTMEYRFTNIGDTWINVTGTTIALLAAGTYSIRIKAIEGTSFSSNERLVEIIETSASSEGGWTLTHTFPGNVATLVGSFSRVPLSDWNGFDGSQELDEDALYDESYESMDDIKVHLYAKFITDDDFYEVYFDNFGLGESKNNHMQRWGFVGGANPYIQLIGVNTTGVDIELKLVKEE